MGFISNLHKFAEIKYTANGRHYKAGMFYTANGRHSKAGMF